MHPTEQRQKRKGNWVPGPGRPPGAKNKRTLSLEAALEEAQDRINTTLPKLENLDAHAFLRTVYRDPEAPLLLRLDAAKSALRVEMPSP